MDLVNIIYSVVTGIELVLAIGIVLHILHHYTGKDKIIHIGFAIQLFAFTLTFGSILQLRPPSRLDPIIFFVGYLLTHWPRKK